MPRAHPVRNPKIAEPIALRIDQVVDTLGYGSFNQLTEQLLTQMLDMMDQPPATRRVPPIALAVDAIRSSVGSRFPSSTTPSAAAHQAADQALAAVQAGAGKGLVKKR